MIVENRRINHKKAILRVLLYFVIIDICLLTLYPYFVMLTTALKTRPEIFSMEGKLMPIKAMWSNFADIWQIGRAHV